MADQSLKSAIEEERLRSLVLRPASTPQQALARRHLRDHLERQDVAHEEHRSGQRIIASNLTIQEIMNLRRGPFTQSPFQAQRLDIQNIRHLDIAMMPFWKEETREDPVDPADDSE